MSFASLGLSAALLRALDECGYAVPTPIQSQVIPVVLAGRDVLAGAQTGTGKTAGFALPMLQRLAAAGTGRPKTRRVRALILTPTRELAAQVGASVRDYGRHLPLTSAVVFGGVGIHPQITALARGVDVLIATPGRLLDHADQRTVDLSGVEVLVLDEADRMLDMGFQPAIRRVIALLPKNRQTLLFSATFPPDIRKLAGELLVNPASVEVTPPNSAAERVEQTVYFAEKGVKRALLSRLIGDGGWRQVLVFTRTKHGANRLAGQLEDDGFRSAAIHGNKSQGARTKALADFKRGDVRVLVATDIAARGIDIDELPHVVNYELPDAAEHYVHRIGRTGRAGCSGTALSLVASDERPMLRAIERLAGREIARAELPPGLAAEANRARASQPARSDEPRRHAGQPQPPRSGARRGRSRRGHAGHGRPAARG